MKFLVAVRNHASVLLRSMFGVVFFVAVNFHSASAETLVVQGSTTFYQRMMEPYQADIEAKAGHKLKVITNKSSLGLFALFERRADLAMISSSLDSEITALKNSNPTLPFDQLRTFSISRTRIAFAVHPSNSIRAATLATLQRILRGEINNWQQLGGVDIPIRIVVVRGGGGVTTVVESALLKGKPIAAPGVIQVQNGAQVPQVVAQEPGALGVAQLALVQQHKLPELVTDSAVVQELNLITLGEPTPAMQAVIDAARSIAASTGYQR
jgi:ABC-type phosphate transport system substrate-binding protein